MADDLRTCQSCKHWGKDPYGRPESEQPRGEGQSRYGLCGRIVHESEMDPGDPAYVCDASWYAATLYTKHSFSCALWEDD